MGPWNGQKCPNLLNFLCIMPNHPVHSQQWKCGHDWNGNQPWTSACFEELSERETEPFSDWTSSTMSLSSTDVPLSFSPLQSQLRHDWKWNYSSGRSVHFFCLLWHWNRLQNMEDVLHAFAARLQNTRRKKNSDPDRRATTYSVVALQQSQGFCYLWYNGHKFWIVSYPAQEMSVTQAYGDQERT